MTGAAGDIPLQVHRCKRSDKKTQGRDSLENPLPVDAMWHDGISRYVKQSYRSAVRREHPAIDIWSMHWGAVPTAIRYIALLRI